MITEQTCRKAKELVQKMTNAQKAKLLTGQDFWHLNGVEEFGLPALMVTDGPHGLRKQLGRADHVGLNDSTPAVCFPTASTTACSFDPELLFRIGRALGEECLQEEVAVLLGPGVNHKRSPLCGRNFEYFSEDPALTGTLAAALVNGIQITGTGTSLKHFAANSQEEARLLADSEVDERALHEIYLRAFETVVRMAQPATIMTAYNRLNGTYCSENAFLMQKTARGDWGFQGLFVTDWGALNDPVESYKAGLDLEMPGLSKGADRLILQALDEGKFPPERLDEAAAQLLALALHYQTLPHPRYDAAAHLELARQAAAESAVLLKNEGGVLPLAPGTRLAIIGRFAKTPRYQGAGSSKVHPLTLDSAAAALDARGIAYTYAEGYTEAGDTDDARLQAAAACAVAADAAIVFVGLPDLYESEGYDRRSLDLPVGHDRLVEAVAAANPRTIVVLQCGGCVRLPWFARVQAVLLAGLGGCQGGQAVVDLLLGDACPGGRLAETWPLALADTPCAPWYLNGSLTCEYRESIYTGYRYYDTVRCPVQFPFGYGLSYTRFDWSDLAVRQHGGQVDVSLRVQNIGARRGSEVVQLYVAHKDPSIFKPGHELCRFAKLALDAGESRTVSFTLGPQDFAYYNTEIHGWHTQSGTYELQLAASSRNIRLTQTVHIQGDDGVSVPDYHRTAPVYYHPERLHTATRAEFEALLGRPLPPQSPALPLTANSTLADVERAVPSWRSRIAQMRRDTLAEAPSAEDARQAEAQMMQMPLRALGMRGTSKQDIAALVAQLNAEAEAIHKEETQDV